MKKIAIIGSGITGCTLAKYLSGQFEITIFEKSRGIGGRLATRRNENFTFDHGVPFFEVKTNKFKSFLKSTVADGHLKIWKAKCLKVKKNITSKNLILNKKECKFVGTPNMNSFLKNLVKHIDVKLNCKITGVFKSNNLWHLNSTNNHVYGSFDWIVICTPAYQAFELFNEQNSFMPKLKKIKMYSSYSLMLGFKKRLDLDFDILHTENDLVKNIIVNSNKPERNNHQLTSLVINTKFVSKKLCNSKKKVFIKNILNIGSEMAKADLHKYSISDLHFWKYAEVKCTPKFDHLINKSISLGICGDWMMGNNVESGFLSATSFIKKM